MTKTFTTVAAVLTMLAAQSAFAANKPAESTKPTAATCQSLETQYESAAKTHAKADKFKDAEAAYAEGKKLCADGKFADGTAKLHTALKDLGVKATGKGY